MCDWQRAQYELELELPREYKVQYPENIALCGEEMLELEIEMASIESIHAGADGTVAIQIKKEGKSIPIRMSPEVAMKLLVEFTHAINVAQPIWAARQKRERTVTKDDL